MRVTIPRRNFLGGASRQSPHVRGANQDTDVVNFYPSPADGLVTRAPFEHLATADSSFNAVSDNATLHAIDRDTVEKYLVVMQTGDLKVFKADGSTVPVYSEAGIGVAPDFTYLTCTTPRALKAITLADYTLVLNTEQVPVMAADLTPAGPYAAEGYLSSLAGNYNQLYTVKLKKTGGSEKLFAVATYNGTAFLTTHEWWTLKVLEPGVVGGTWRVTTAGVASANVTVASGESSIEVGERLRAAVSAISNVSATGSGGIIYIQSVAGTAATTVTAPTGGKYILARQIMSIATDDIAERFRLLIDADADFQAARQGNVVQVTGATFADTWDTFEASDSAGNTTLKAAWKSVDAIDELPEYARDDHTLLVKGSAASTDDDYYVTFESDVVASQFGKGRWVEGVKPGITYKLDTAKMPWRLVRFFNAGAPYFVWSKAEWNNREAGDATSNKVPAFVGAAIQDMAFFQNRLVLCTATNVLCSETARYFNFWRTTVRTLIDSDTISLGASSPKVAPLSHMVTVDEDLMVFSAQAQYRLDGNPLTPKSAALPMVTQKTAEASVRPVVLGRNVFYLDASRLHELFRVPESSFYSETEASAGVPGYFGSAPSGLAAHTSESVVFVQHSDASGLLSCFKFYDAGNERQMASWFQIRTAYRIAAVAVLGDYLYALLAYPGNSTLGLTRMRIPPQRKPYTVPEIQLDRRTPMAGQVSTTYSADSDTTAIVTQHSSIPNSALFRVVGTDGKEFPIVSKSSATVVVSGNATGGYVVGEAYTARVDLSPIYVRETQRAGGAVILSGRFRVSDAYVAFASTGTFVLGTTIVGGGGHYYTFNNRVLTEPDNLLDTLAPQTRIEHADIAGVTGECSHWIESTATTPCILESIEWQGSYSAKSTRRLT